MRLPTTLSALLLAACAAPATQWEKPGASQTAVDADLQQCRMQARVASAPSLRSRSPHSAVGPATEMREDRDAREVQLFQKCMQDRGYSAKR